MFSFRIVLLGTGEDCRSISSTRADDLQISRNFASTEARRVLDLVARIENGAGIVLASTNDVSGVHTTEEAATIAEMLFEETVKQFAIRESMDRMDDDAKENAPRLSCPGAVLHMRDVVAAVAVALNPAPEPFPLPSAETLPKHDALGNAMVDAGMVGPDAGQGVALSGSGNSVPVSDGTGTVSTETNTNADPVGATGEDAKEKTAPESNN